MQEATQHTPTPAGSVRRLRTTTGAGPPPPPTSPAPSPNLLDLRPTIDPDLEVLAEQVARLETGMRLIADTVKRAFLDISAALEEVRASVYGTATPDDVRDAVRYALRPLEAAVDSLRDRIQTIPQAAEIAKQVVDRSLPVAIATATDLVVQRLVERRVLSGQPPRARQRVGLEEIWRQSEGSG